MEKVTAMLGAKESPVKGDQWVHFSARLSSLFLAVFTLGVYRICCTPRGVTSAGANRHVPLRRSGNNRGRAAARCTARRLCLRQRDMGVIEYVIRRQLHRPRLGRLSCAQWTIVIAQITWNRAKRH